MPSFCILTWVALAKRNGSSVVVTTLRRDIGTHALTPKHLDEVGKDTRY